MAKTCKLFGKLHKIGHGITENFYFYSEKHHFRRIFTAKHEYFGPDGQNLHCFEIYAI